MPRFDITNSRPSPVIVGCGRDAVAGIEVLEGLAGPAVGDEHAVARERVDEQLVPNTTGCAGLAAVLGADAPQHVAVEIDRVGAEVGDADVERLAVGREAADVAGRARQRDVVERHAPAHEAGRLVERVDAARRRRRVDEVADDERRRVDVDEAIGVGLERGRPRDRAGVLAQRDQRAVGEAGVDQVAVDRRRRRGRAACTPRASRPCTAT